MCGRYSLHTHPEVIALYFKLGLLPDITPRYNITPGTNILIVRQNPEQGRIADLYRWGLIPGWAKDPAIGNKLANARAETVAEKPSFRSAFKRGRCLIPASGFYEWKKVAGRKQPYYVRPVGADLFSLAGLTERWMGPDGPVHSCTIITTDANDLMRDIHDRMPVILAPEDHAAWLDPANQATEKLKALLKPSPAKLMAAHPVSTRVNTPKNDEPALIEPVAA
ncbi:MAG TPA: SOS response-associated peptidase [Burkholderiales bacterium]